MPRPGSVDVFINEDDLDRRNMGPEDQATASCHGGSRYLIPDPSVNSGDKQENGLIQRVKLGSFPRRGIQLCLRSIMMILIEQETAGARPAYGVSQIRGSNLQGDFTRAHAYPGGGGPLVWASNEEREEGISGEIAFDRVEASEN